MKSWEDFQDEFGPIESFNANKNTFQADGYFWKILAANGKDTQNELAVSKFLENVMPDNTVFAVAEFSERISNAPEWYRGPIDSEYICIAMEPIEYAFDALPNEPIANENFFWEILVGLYYARKKGPFVHHDIHEGNLMFDMADEASDKAYKIEDDFYVEFKTLIFPKLIDYGKSVINKESKRIFDRSDIRDLSRIFTHPTRHISESFRNFLTVQIEEGHAFRLRFSDDMTFDENDDHGGNYMIIVELLRKYFQNPNLQCAVCWTEPARYRDINSVYCSKECQIGKYNHQLKTTFITLCTTAL